MSLSKMEFCFTPQWNSIIPLLSFEKKMEFRFSVKQNSVTPRLSFTELFLRNTKKQKFFIEDR